MDKINAELLYYLHEQLWHTEITFYTEELEKGRDHIYHFGVVSPIIRRFSY